MQTRYGWVLMGSALLLVGCANMQEFLQGVEPILDIAVSTAASSARIAAEEAAAKNGVDPALVGSVTVGGIAALWASVKGLVYAWNREPQKA